MAFLWGRAGTRAPARAAKHFSIAFPGSSSPRSLPPNVALVASTPPNTLSAWPAHLVSPSWLLLPDETQQTVGTSL